MQKRSVIILVAVGLLLLLLVSGCRDKLAGETVAPGPVLSETVAEPVRLPEMEQGEVGDHAVLRLPDLPPNFRVAGWLDGETLVGISSDRVTAYELYTSQTRTLGGPAWNVWPAPDGSRVAYNNEQGIYVVDAGGGEPVLAVPKAAEEASPPQVAVWAPDSRSFVFLYEYEWDARFFVYDLDQNQVTPLETEMEDYFLKEAVAWPEQDRILFVVRASAKKDGSREYNFGYRADFAVFNLQDGTFTRITGLDDGRFAAFQGLAPDGRFAYVIRDEEQRPLETGLMDSAGRTENRRAMDPRVAGLLTSLAGGSVYYLQPVDRPEPGEILRLLVEEKGTLVPVAEIVHDGDVRYSRSPEGSRLAVTFTARVNPQGASALIGYGYLLIERPQG